MYIHIDRYHDSLDPRYLEFENSFKLPTCWDAMLRWTSSSAWWDPLVQWVPPHRSLHGLSRPMCCHSSWQLRYKSHENLQRSQGKEKGTDNKTEGGLFHCFIDLQLFGNVWNIWRNHRVLFCFWCMGKYGCATQLCAGSTSTMDLPPPLRRAYSQWTRQRLQLLKRRGSRLWRMVGCLLHTACFSKDREPLETLFERKLQWILEDAHPLNSLRFRGIAELGRCIGRLGGPEVGFHLGHRHLSLATMPPCQASQLLVGLFKLVKGSGDLLMLEFSSLFAGSFPHTSCTELIVVYWIFHPRPRPVPIPFMKWGRLGSVIRFGDPTSYLGCCLENCHFFIYIYIYIFIPLTISSTEWVNMCYLQKLCRVLFCTVKVMLGTAFCRKQAFCRE